MHIASRIAGLLCVVLSSSLTLPAARADFVSTGANGALIILDNTSLDAGRYDFTDVFIDTNAMLSFNPSPGTLDIFLLAQGSVTINGGLYAPGANLYISTPALLTINGPVRTGNVYLSAGSIYSSGSGSIAGGVDVTGTVGSLPGACGMGVAGTVSIGGADGQAPSGSCAIITAGGSMPVSGGSVSLTPTPLPGSAVLFLAGLPLLALFLHTPAPAHGSGSGKGLAYQSA